MTYIPNNRGKDQLIYTLFAELETGSVLPVAFAILPDKSSVSYALHAFHMLRPFLHVERILHSSLHWSFDCFLCHFSTNGAYSE